MKKIVFAVLGTFLSLGSYGGDWPLWRGPDRNDLSKEKGLLQERR